MTRRIFFGSPSGSISTAATTGMPVSRRASLPVKQTCLALVVLVLEAELHPGRIDQLTAAAGRLAAPAAAAAARGWAAARPAFSPAGGLGLASRLCAAARRCTVASASATAASADGGQSGWRRARGPPAEPAPTRSDNSCDAVPLSCCRPQIDYESICLVRLAYYTSISADTDIRRRPRQCPRATVNRRKIRQQRDPDAACLIAAIATADKASGAPKCVLAKPLPPYKLAFAGGSKSRLHIRRRPVRTIAARDCSAAQLRGARLAGAAGRRRAGGCGAAAHVPRRRRRHRHRHAWRAGLAGGLSALPYANPDAPKGGRLVEGVLGTFDSLNPLIVKGLAVQPIRGYVDREPDGARLRRAVHALRPAGADASRPTRRAATSPSRSIPPRISPTARRSRRRTWCSPGSSCATTAGRTTAPITPRSPRRKFSTRAPCASISPIAATANCR